MCGRYLFDPMTGELDEYWQIIADVAKKQKKYKEQEIATGEVFPSNNVLTLGANKNNEVVPGITKWGFEGFKKESSSSMPDRNQSKKRKPLASISVNVALSFR